MKCPYSAFVEAVPVPAVLTTLDSSEPVILASNKLHTQLTGYSEAEAINQSPRIFKGPLTDLKESTTLKICLKEHDFYSGEIINYRKDKTAYFMVLSIFGVIIEGKRYYCALKQYIRDV